VLAAWAALQVSLRRPASIADDWHGWRQTDTQTIARNLADDSLDVLYPRVAWGGDGPGYVETEFQLYAALVATVLYLAGPAEWPGQLLSLAFVALAVLLLFRMLRPRFGPAAALAACALVLAGRGATYLSTSIQPDTLSFLAFTAGFGYFLEFLEREGRGPLVAAMAWTAVAALVKPTTLQLGVVQFMLVLVTRPGLLRRLDLWLGWLAVLALLGLFLLHASSLYHLYGNTFGTVSGGDLKFPALRHLTSPTLLVRLGKQAVYWGTGIPAALAAMVLLVRRDLDPPAIALAAGGLVMELVGMRYACEEWGSHYHIPLAVLGAWLLARAWWRFALPGGAGLRRVAAGACAALVAAQYAFFVREIRREPTAREVVMGRELAARVRPGELAVVRSQTHTRDDFWSTDHNFEDPRIFYLAQVRGWALPWDRTGADAVAGPAARGARSYVEIHRRRPDPELYRWLEDHAELVVDRPEGRIWTLPGRGPRLGPEPLVHFQAPPDQGAQRRLHPVDDGGVPDRPGTQARPQEVVVHAVEPLPALVGADLEAHAEGHRDRVSVGHPVGRVERDVDALAGHQVPVLRALQLLLRAGHAVEVSVAVEPLQLLRADQRPVRGVEGAQALAALDLQEEVGLGVDVEGSDVAR
jgi:4-amino-4-deoxy-L-arabinose transferase-like glycosyltransferase